MRKTDKKIENQLIGQLNEVCHFALDEFNGFKWLTHQVNYAQFPKSLRVVCVFDTRDNLQQFIMAKSQQALGELIVKKLLDINVVIKHQQILYDSEQSCQQDNNGNWAQRLG
ncbi:Fis family transcriptional regulator [Shewanella subflava]|uniref:Fis family transcriptional regulator n=1 Tax=Shewanella subflava TaxID=2986476 RepID=A0ABT3I8Y3_9GAMM|nr:Fis family transcriptional regulator [Shewanella subflava]MCW3172467.1 Fis family transcriptional regulator [Shewanella subflava]